MVARIIRKLTLHSYGNRAADWHRGAADRAARFPAGLRFQQKPGAEIHGSVAYDEYASICWKPAFTAARPGVPDAGLPPLYSYRAVADLSAVWAALCRGRGGAYPVRRAFDRAALMTSVAGCSRATRAGRANRRAGRAILRAVSLPDLSESDAQRHGAVDLAASTSLSGCCCGCASARRWTGDAAAGG